jgi:hypothetical protein
VTFPVVYAFGLMLAPIVAVAVVAVLANFEHRQHQRRHDRELERRITRARGEQRPPWM